MADSARILPVREGDVIAGKYRLDKLLGVGATAVVFRATHVELQLEVAIRLLRPEHVSRPDTVKRFLRDARAAVRLRSAHVARVLDVGTTAVDALAIPFMVMELLEGADFEKMLAARGHLAPEEAVDFILQACDALGEAHALGIIHRGLAPANLFLTTRRDGTPLVKLLDFGISKTRRADGKKISQEDAFPGSPAYMSPEQIRSTKDADERADIWALGAILYQLLTGKVPWSGETSAVTLAMILNDPPAPIDVPEPLETVVRRCLEKEATNRFQSIGDLANALAPFARHAQMPGPPSSQRIVAAFEANRVALTSAADSSPPPSSRSSAIPALSSTGPLHPKPAPWWQLPAIIGGAVCAVAIVVVVLLSGEKHPAPPPAAASIAPPLAADPVPSASIAPVTSASAAPRAAASQ